MSIPFQDLNQLVIITGISGSGKSTALDAFEDIGFFCIDNLPAALITGFVDFLLSKRDPLSESTREFSQVRQKPWRFALLVDCRDESSYPQVKSAICKLRNSSTEVSLLYFDCQEEVVVRRFRETRRPHPLRISHPSIQTLTEAIRKERELLADFRGVADRIIDTTIYSPHELRALIEKFSLYESNLEVIVLSFGFKYGLPHDADLVADVRFLPNPHFVSEMRELTGLDEKVQDYVLAGEDANCFLDRYMNFLEYVIPRYKKEGKRYLTVAIGCTGGRHRSVTIANQLITRLISIGVNPTMRHRDVNRVE